MCATSASGQSAAYLQTVPVKAGERYLVVVWTCGGPAGQTAGARLLVRYRTPTGWSPREDVEPVVEARPLGDWQPLMVAVTVPEGATTMVVMPAVNGQPAGTRALFDDAAAYRLP